MGRGATGAAIPVILNPAAGGGRPLAEKSAMDAAAAEAGVVLEWHPTDHPGHAGDIASELAVDGHPMVVAMGGDGTYNEVARGLLGTATALGILPAGTTSVLAYEIGLPHNLRKALFALLGGRDEVMRVGRTDHGDLVLLMLSAGPDSVVLERVRPGLKRLGGKFAIAMQAVRHVFSTEPMPRFQVVTDGGVFPTGWTIIGKGQRYAGPFRATPGANPFEPNLEAVVQTAAGRGAAVPFAAALMWARHIRRPDVRRFLGDRFRLELNGCEGPVPYQVDGDVKGTLPVSVAVDPAPLLLRVP
jgi:diacylglycerol kinase (ATP)